MASESKSIYKAQCPGSLMIMGEHAVLYGQPAIVAAINKTLNIELQVAEHANPTVLIKTSLNGDLKYTSSLINLESNKQLKYVLAVIELFKADLLKLNKSLYFNIKSDINHTMGLGSSGAVTITSIKVIVNCLIDYKYLDFDIDSAEYKAFILKIGKKVINKVQGTGSGADLVASLYGGVNYYQANTNYREHIAASLPIMAIYSGYKLSTKDVLKQMAEDKRFSTNYDDSDLSIFQQIGCLVQNAKEAIVNKNWQLLGELFNKHYMLQKSLGVSDSHLEYIVSQLVDNENILGSKISGSGLGDCVIALLSAKFNNNLNIDFSHPRGTMLPDIVIA